MRIHVDDRVKRAVVFYFSVALFFFLLPIVLSYSLGYSIDFQNFKIYKTGMIYLKSQPAGARIYLNGWLFPDVTPAKIEELKPGIYRVEIKRDGFYPWQKDLVVRPNMVTKADEVVLFSLKQDMRKMSELGITDFLISDKNYIYYMTEIGLVRSNMDGTGLKRLSSYSSWPQRIIGKKFCMDGDKFVYFDEKHVWAAHLTGGDPVVKDGESARIDMLVSAPDTIKDVFWYSDSKHIVFVTDKDINVVELYGKGERNAVMLYKFNAPPREVYYDTASDSLYFTDYSAKSADSGGKSFLYRLDLRQKFFGQLIQRLRREFDIGYETK